MGCGGVEALGVQACGALRGQGVGFIGFRASGAPRVLGLRVFFFRGFRGFRA